MSADPRLVSPAEPLNLADRFLHHHVREGRGERRALIVDRLGAPPETYSYAEVSAAAARCGHLLAARGIGLEDRVFIVLEDGLDWVSAFFGALGVGATVMFVNPRVSSEELDFYLHDSRARAIVTDRDTAARLPGARPFLRTIVELDDPKTRAGLDRLPAEPSIASTTAEDFAIWLYSSGSTGAPKAAVHRAADFVFNTEHYAAKVLRFTPDDVSVSVPKLFFGYATGSNLLFPFYFGATAVLFPDKPTPERLFELCERHRATMLVSVPTMIAQMAERWETAETRPDVSALRVVTSAGEALPPELYHRWKRGPGVEILDGIGSAEMFHVFISNRLDDVRPGSLGTLVEGYEARVVGPDGRDVAPGEIGTLWVGGPSSAAFYWQRAEKSREVLRGHWVVSGDQFIRDEAGHFTYVGRADDLMKVKGRWLAPQEVEDALTRHPAVAEAGAAGFVHEGLTKPMAFVVLRQGHEASEALAAELSQHVADTTEPYKAPRFVEFVPSLPRGDRDKLDRKRLAESARAAADARGLEARA